MAHKPAEFMMTRTCYATRGEILGSNVCNAPASELVIPRYFDLPERRGELS
jgi:hypothetical protein